MSKRVFLTGLKGFTGQYLYRELEANGYDVFGIVKQGDSAEDSVTFECDLLDRDRLAQLIKQIKPNFIVNLAGISNVSHASALEMYQVNQLGALSLLEAIEVSGHPPDKILLISSAYVYGNQQAQLLVENSPLRPNSDYAISKLAMEQVASLWYDRLPIIIARPFNYTGVNQAPLFLPSKIVHHFIIEASHIQLGNLEVTRDWLDVRDVVGIYRRLLESSCDRITVNVCSGVSHSLQKVMETMEQISGYSMAIKVDSKLIRANEISNLQGSSQLLDSLVGRVQKYSLKDTLTWMYSSDR